MSHKVDINNMGTAITKVLSDFEKATYQNVKAAAQKTAAEVSKQTKGQSPSRTKKYRAGWGSTVQSDNSRQFSVTVHNKAKPGLTHLLEHGHGGPHPAPAHEHIVKDDESQALFERNLIREMQG